MLKETGRMATECGQDLMGQDPLSRKGTVSFAWAGAPREGLTDAADAGTAFITMNDIARETNLSPSAHMALRTRTAAAHEAIDGAFARFDLADRDSYRAFLRSHARVLFALEAMLESEPGLPVWRSRKEALDADLASLGDTRPEPLAIEPITGEAALHGLLYVLEGSRLGGKLLSRQVGEGLPSAFLAATHEKGEWRAFLSHLDQRAQANGPEWLDQAVDGASRAFTLYGHAAKAS